MWIHSKKTAGERKEERKGKWRIKGDVEEVLNRRIFVSSIILYLQCHHTPALEMANNNLNCIVVMFQKVM